MTSRHGIRLATINIGAPDPGVLARFYGALLGWPIGDEEPDWVVIRPPDGNATSVSFQTEEQHVRPVWPGRPGEQQMQLHLEIQVDDLDAAAAYAVELGATVHEHQPQDDVRVCIDPAGHPFCLWIET